MVNTFQLNKKYAEWAERTVYNYFKEKRAELGIDIFYFGSQVETVEHDYGDAPLRPDFIFIKTQEVKELEDKYDINFNDINIKRLSGIVSVSPKEINEIDACKEYWMTKVPDAEPLLIDIVKRAHCLLEIKSGFWIFDQNKYDTGNYNIMLPITFFYRIKKLEEKFKTSFKIYAAYVLLDKAYIASAKKIENLGTNRKYTDNPRTYRVLPFKDSYFFADILGVVQYNKSKPEILAKPTFDVDKGEIIFSLVMPPGKMDNVNTQVIKNLLD